MINDPIIGESIGLILISIGWLLQIIHSWSGRREIRKRTLICYGLGVAILIINGAFSGSIDAVFYLNIVTLVLACVLLMRVSKSEVAQDKTKRNSRRKKKR